MSLPPVEVPQGAIRFNTDSQKLEFYAQDQWWEMVIDTPALGTSSDTGAGARGVFMSGYTGSPAVSANTLDYVNISSSGNAIDFGDLLVAVNSAATASSSTRGLSFGGSLTNTINYITISSTGDAQDFGDLTQSITQSTGVSNSTRGIRRGGQTPGGTNTIDYVTIASTGDAQDFGDSIGGSSNSAGTQNSTRGVFIGQEGTPTKIDYITISTLGNTQNFGSVNGSLRYAKGCSNAIRGLAFGGLNPTPTMTSGILYVTLSTLGNSIDFGNLSSATNVGGSCSSSTRGLHGGGQNPGSIPAAYTNVVEYVTILTQGNAVDFGDLTRTDAGINALSNAHGGL
jgi:hypothetical protein